MTVEREFQVKKTTRANPCGKSEQGKNVGVAEGRERRKRYEIGLETCRTLTIQYMEYMKD